MGFRYRKSLKIAPGVRVNVGKRGVTSVSAGRRGFTTNVSKRGTRHTISAPGTGLSYRTAAKKGGCGPCVVPVLVVGSMVAVLTLRGLRTARRRMAGS